MRGMSGVAKDRGMSAMLFATHRIQVPHGGLLQRLQGCRRRFVNVGQLGRQPGNVQALCKALARSSNGARNGSAPRTRAAREQRCLYGAGPPRGFAFPLKRTLPGPAQTWQLHAATRERQPQPQPRQARPWEQARAFSQCLVGEKQGGEKQGV